MNTCTILKKYMYCHSVFSILNLDSLLTMFSNSKVRTYKISVYMHDNLIKNTCTVGSYFRF